MFDDGNVGLLLPEVHIFAVDASFVDPCALVSFVRCCLGASSRIVLSIMDRSSIFGLVPYCSKTTCGMPLLCMCFRFYSNACIVVNQSGIGGDTVM